jgi:hypothetical protein
VVRIRTNDSAVNNVGKIERETDAVSATTTEEIVKRPCSGLDVMCLESGATQSHTRVQQQQSCILWIRLDDLKR